MVSFTFTRDYANYKLAKYDAKLLEFCNAVCPAKQISCIYSTQLPSHSIVYIHQSELAIINFVYSDSTSPSVRSPSGSPMTPAPTGGES